MSLAELKREVAGLSPAEQAELVAYINDQLQPDDPAYRRELARLLDDQDRRNSVRWNLGWIATRMENNYCFITAIPQCFMHPSVATLRLQKAFTQSLSSLPCQEIRR